MTETKNSRTTRSRRTRSEWANEVERWRSSGQSAKAYAAQHHIHPDTLTWWARRLDASKEEIPSQCGTAKKFLPLVVRDSVTPTSENTQSRIEVGLTNGRYVCVPVDLELAKLRQLVEALEGTTPC